MRIARPSRVISRGVIIVSEFSNIVPVLADLSDAIQLAAIGLWTNFGSVQDTGDGHGLPHMLEHVLLTAPPGQRGVAEITEELGGRVNALTSKEHIVFYAQCRPRDLETVAHALIDSVVAPVFDTLPVASERDVIMQELNAGENDPSDWVQDLWFEKAFADTSFAWPVGGRSTSLVNPSTADLQGWHAAAFSRRSFGMTFAGPTECAAPIARLAEHSILGLLPTGADPVITKSSQPLLGARGYREMRSGNRADYCYAVVGGHSAGVDDLPGRASAEVLAQLFGPSNMSPLSRTLRQSGLAYEFTAWNTPYRTTGAWRVLVGASEHTITSCVSEIRALLLHVAGGSVSPTDLDVARRQAVMTALLDSESALDRMLRLGRAEGLRTRLSLSNLVSAIDAVELLGVVAAAQNVLGSLAIAVANRVQRYPSAGPARGTA